VKGFSLGPKTFYNCNLKAVVITRMFVPAKLNLIFAGKAKAYLLSSGRVLDY
jgi:nucleoside recognition membrane protein YjiH